LIKKNKKALQVISERLVCNERGEFYSSAQSNLPEEVVKVKKVNQVEVVPNVKFICITYQIKKYCQVLRRQEF